MIHPMNATLETELQWQNSAPLPQPLEDLELRPKTLAEKSGEMCSGSWKCGEEAAATMDGNYEG